MAQSLPESEKSIASAEGAWRRLSVSHEYRPGDYIFQEGEPGDALYMIETGRVAVIKGATSGNPIVLSYHGPGNLIGEISLLSEMSRSASVMAIEETTALRISLDDFWVLFDEISEFRRLIVRTLIGHILSADQGRLMAAATERELFSRLASLSNEHERLAEVMRLRQETLHFIVHDLRNPLNLVMTALAMLQETPGFEADSEMGELVSMASGGVQRMLALVDAILDVERLEAGVAALDRVPVDMLKLAAEVVERLKPMAATGHITLTFEPADQSFPYIRVDRQRMDRVLANLIDNALKFTPPSGKVTVTMRADETWLTVSVNDTGPGIPPEQRERVFDRFVQGDHADQSRRGFGLGLPYCRSAITAHGGRIWVDEGDGDVGSKFTFIVPIQT